MTPDSIQFHIRSGDFFGTLATVLDLLRQDAARGYDQSTTRHSSASGMTSSTSKDGTA